MLDRLTGLNLLRSRHTLDAFGNIDSKYRFIILAAKRAKQLLKGAKPKIQGRSKNPIRIAQAEVRRGLIEYEIIPTHVEEAPEREERVFVGGGLPDEGFEAEAGKDVSDEGIEAGTEEEPEEGETEEGEESENEDLPKDDEKDD
jgi:DNA-directed RNA polymerase subunit omega